MAAWYALAATYLPDIIKLAVPLFTRTRSQEKTPEVMAQQIVELQNAALQNADSIKLMATEMQKTIEALQAGAVQLDRRLRHAQMLAGGAAIIALLAFGVAAYALGA